MLYSSSIFGLFVVVMVRCTPKGSLHLPLAVIRSGGTQGDLVLELTMVGAIAIIFKSSSSS